MDIETRARGLRQRLEETEELEKTLAPSSESCTLVVPYMLAGDFNHVLLKGQAPSRVHFVVESREKSQPPTHWNAAQAANCETDKGVNCLDGFVASEHMTPMVAGQLVRNICGYKGGRCSAHRSTR